ncbi:hypothetical protein B0J14DRAFT_471242 [Halenospora varia]|nr:hypothetical protein B0J14DRAFT_471242 [Halenospora varia]
MASQDIPSLEGLQIRCSGSVNYTVVPQDIPARVNAFVRLEVRKSELKEDGKGVYTTAAIKAGDIIFCVEKPLMNVISFVRLTPKLV